MQEVSVMAAFSPSFSSYSTIRFSEIADKVSEEFTLEREKFGLDQSSEKEDQAEDDFEFAFVCRDSDMSQSISADEIFSNGKIRPKFPIFDQNFLSGNHDNIPVHNKEVHSNKQLLTKASSGRLRLSELFTEQRDLSSSTSSSLESEECERVQSGTYCMWTPRTVPSSPITCKKCYSCRSPPRRFRLKDLIHRSNSDVNDSFVSSSPSSSLTNRSKSKKSSDEKKVNEKSTSEVLDNPMNAVKAKVRPKISSHEHYLKNRALKEGDRRRTYLPYRRDLIGFFGYLNGWSFRKPHHPFQTA